jgi:hypothetical protein
MALHVVSRTHHQVGVVLTVGAHEHPGPATTQAGRIDPGVFHGLPRRLQQQPLLRIHRQRLPRGDPEEPRIELGDPVEEPTHPGRAVSPTVPGQQPQIPAPIGRERSDPVATIDQQLPQLLRRAHPTREPAAHPHDRDRLIRNRHQLRRWDSRRIVGFQQFAEQVLGQRRRGRVVEHQRRGQPQPGRGAEPVPQLNRGQRIKAQIPERLTRLDRVPTGMAEHRGDLLTHQVQHQPQPVTDRSGSQPGLPPRTRGLLLLPGLTNLLQHRPGLRQLRQQRPRPQTQQRPQHLRMLQLRHDHHRARLNGHLTEHRHRQLRIQTHRTPPGQALTHPGRTGHPTTGPRTPRHRRRRQPRRPPPRRHRVEHRIGRRIVGLPRIAHRPGHRREQHERRQVQPAGQLVQQHRRGHLGPEHRLEALRVQPVKHPVIQHPGRVHHPGQRRIRRHPGQQPSQRGPISHITCRDRHLRAQPDQLRPQRLRPRRRRPLPTGQQHMPHTLGSQPAGHVPTQRTGPTRDQHRARRAPHPSRPIHRGRQQPPTEHPRRTHRDLVLIARPGQHRHQPRQHRPVQHHGQVHQTTPPRRILQRRDPAQTPNPSLTHPNQQITDQRIPGRQVTGPSRTGQRITGWQVTGQRIPGADADRATRQRPHRRGDPGIPQRLHQHRGRRHPHRHPGHHRIRDRQQRHHPGHPDTNTSIGTGQPGQPPRQLLPVTPVDSDPHHTSPQAGNHLINPAPGRHRTTRHHHQPGPSQPTPTRHTQRRPNLTETPGLHHRLSPSTLPPRRQRRQHLRHRPRTHPQRRRQRRQIPILDRSPEPSLHRIHTRHRRRRQRRPEPLMLERIRRQIHPLRTQPGEPPRPVHPDPGHVQSGQSGGERGGLVTSGAQC